MKENTTSEYVTWHRSCPADLRRLLTYIICTQIKLVNQEMFDDDDVCASFTLLLKGIQTETRVLKCVSQLRSLPPNDNLTEKIIEIEMAVQNIEKNLENFNEFLSSEINTCEMIENETIKMAEQQSHMIKLLQSSLPQTLKDVVATSKLATSKDSLPNVQVTVSSIGRAGASKKRP